MQFSASSSRVLVSGASGVLGGAIVRALCQNLTRENAAQRVVGVYYRNAAAAQQLQNETGCTLAHADLCQENAVEKLWREYEPLNALVHGIGISRDHLLVRTPYDAWHHTLRVNVESAFLMLRAALQRLPEGGRAVVLASRVGEQGARGQCAYAASKAALIGLMKCAAREGGARQIAVNAICPAFTVSPMTPLSASIVQEQRARDVFGELGQSDSTAHLVRWLLSEDARGISGQVFHADARWN